MVLDEPTRSVVASVVGGSAYPQADDTRAPAIALGTTRSTINELQAPMNRQLAAHATGKRTRGFTLTELVVTMGVLVLLVFLATQLLNSAATIAVLGHKQMDADSQARQLLDRMAIDFAQMVKRSDVDYYVKSSSFATGAPTPAPPGARTVLQPGNDQIAFYSAVPGYYPTLAAPTPTATPNSPVSLVAYRVNSDTSSSAYNKMERMGKGLVWNGVSPSDTPVVFIPIPVASPLSFGDVPMSPTPTPTPTPAASPAWPQAGNMTADASYEVVGPQVFRFEYYYMLKGQASQVGAPTPTPTPNPAIFSDTPWDTRISGHYSVSGMRDVAAIIVVIAVIDPKSKVLLDNSAQVPPPNDNITLLGAQLIDWGNTTCPGCATLACPSQQDWQTTPGLLRAQWQCVLNAIIANGGQIGNTGTFLPLAALSGIRVYERCFYLNQ